MAQEIVFPHAFRIESDSIYQARVQRYKHQTSKLPDSAVFQAVYSDYRHNVVVGRLVTESGTPRVITGAEKYVQGYFDILLKTVLLKLAPEGHPNIILSIAHPPDATPQLDNLLRVVGGKHKIIRHDGKEITWMVQAVVPFDEPAGGLQRAMTHEYAAYNPHEIDPGDKVMVVDIGGKISSMTPAIVLDHRETETLWNDGAVFELGIQDIKENLDTELRALYPDVFKGKVAENIIEKAIRAYGLIEIQGRPMDVRDAVHLATAPLLNDIERVYVRDMRRAFDVKHIFISGGGGGTLNEMLKTDVFQHPCSLTEVIRDIHLANFRGGKIAFQQLIHERRDTDFRKLYQKAVEPLLICGDLGNSLIKAGLVNA